MVDVLFNALYFFLPAYVANTVPGILGYGRPVDLGRKFTDGRRILGNGVTVRGTLTGILGGTIIGFLKDEPLLGFVLGVGAMGGDMIGSFIKRRLGKSSGSPLFPLDQLNFVIGGLILARLYLGFIRWDFVVVIVLLTPVGHLAVNKLGYHLNMKDVPW